MYSGTLHKIDTWGCPEGYLMLHDACYKHIHMAKSHASAQHFCEAEGQKYNVSGALATPTTYFKVITSNISIIYIYIYNIVPKSI